MSKSITSRLIPNFTTLLLSLLMALIGGSAWAKSPGHDGRNLFESYDWRQRAKVDRGWELLGRRRVEFFVINRDTINIGRKAGRFNTFRPEAEMGEVFLAVVRIVYGNGDVQVFTPRQVLKASGRGLIFDLEGRNRFIKSVTLTYRGFPSIGGRPRVALWGNSGRLFGGNRRRAWVDLGSQTARRKVEVDILPVGPEKGRFEALQFVVSGNRLRIKSIKVTYGNGQVQKLPIRGDFDPGPIRPVIDLPGGGPNGRAISLISIKYRTLNRGQFRGQITVRGKRAFAGGGRPFGGGGPGVGPRGPRGAGPGGPAPNFAQSPNWRRLGAKKVGSFVIDRDVIKVSGNEGRFVRLGLSVKRGTVFLESLRVVFKNGQFQKFAPNRAIDGRTAAVFDFPGNARLIDRVELRYRNLPKGGLASALLQPIVEIWGRVPGRGAGPGIGGGAAKPGGFGGPGRDMVFDRPPAGWDVIADQQLDPKSNRVRLGISHPRRRYDAVRLFVENVGIEVFDFDVILDNGQRLDLKTREVVKAGGSTRILRLPGSGHRVTTAILKYEPLRQKRRPRAVVWGRRAN